MLTAISSFWFDQVADLLPNHVISVDPADLPAAAGPMPTAGRCSCAAPSRSGWSASLAATSSAVRGRVSGARHGAGPPMPAGMQRGGGSSPRRSSRPRRRPRNGHDQPMTDAEAIDAVGEDIFGRLRDAALAIYERGAALAEARGIILADTKFEFGLTPDGELLLIDEVLTPDSSRYWPAEDYAVGGSPPSFDKQYVRDYYLTLDWDRTPPAPPFPVPGHRGDPAALCRGLRTAHRPILRRRGTADSLDRDERSARLMTQYEARIDVEPSPRHPRPAGRHGREGAPGARVHERDAGLGGQVHPAGRRRRERGHAARAQVDEMCHRLLANPVIEAFTISISELVT